MVVLGESKLMKDAYLAGGTALALQIGHRVSVDFDFFTPKTFSEQILIQKLLALSVDFKYRYTDYAQKEDNQEEAIRLGFKYRF